MLNGLRQSSKSWMVRATNDCIAEPFEKCSPHIREYNIPNARGPLFQPKDATREFSWMFGLYCCDMPPLESEKTQAYGLGHEERFLLYDRVGNKTLQEPRGNRERSRLGPERVSIHRPGPWRPLQDQDICFRSWCCHQRPEVRDELTHTHAVRTCSTPPLYTQATSSPLPLQTVPPATDSPYTALRAILLCIIDKFSLLLGITEIYGRGISLLEGGAGGFPLLKVGREEIFPPGRQLWGTHFKSNMYFQ